MNPNADKENILRAYRKVYWRDVPCWEYPLALNAYGYAVLRRKEFKKLFGKSMLFLHNLIYELLVGKIPEGKELDHKCRNPKCCCPFHLQPVSHKKNIRRAALQTKLTNEEVKEIRKKMGSEYKWTKCVKLGKKYGVSGQQIKNICTGKCWHQKIRGEGIGKWKSV